MVSLRLWQLPSRCKATQSCRMGKVLKIHEVVPICTRGGSSSVYLRESAKDQGTTTFSGCEEMKLIKHSKQAGEKKYPNGEKM